MISLYPPIFYKIFWWGCFNCSKMSHVILKLCFCLNVISFWRLFGALDYCTTCTTMWYSSEEYTTPVYGARCREITGKISAFSSPHVQQQPLLAVLPISHFDAHLHALCLSARTSCNNPSLFCVCCREQQSRCFLLVHIKLTVFVFIHFSLMGQFKDRSAHLNM